jgi:lysozyme
MPSMNDAGFALLRKWEGCILHAYDDANDHPVSPGDAVLGTLTIGYGHTGSDVFPGLTWTQQEAEDGLKHDIAAVINQITPLITAKLNDNQFSAFVCFAFNIGLHAFAGSSALHLANGDNFQEVPSHIALWNKTTINGHLVVSNGLKNRRQAEMDLWNTAA